MSTEPSQVPSPHATGYLLHRDTKDVPRVSVQERGVILLSPVVICSNQSALLDQVTLIQRDAELDVT